MQKINKFVGILVLTAILILVGSLWQSNVLKVDASVQVLLVSHTTIPFGTVFPGEDPSETYTVALDTSANSATYITSIHPLEGFLDLCPLLEITPIDNPVEAGDDFTDATLTRPSDVLDKWMVRLKVPAIEGYVSQGHDGEIIIRGGDYGCKIIIIVKKQKKFTGCTPGYWKQYQHFDSWVGYAPNTQFSAVFENAFPGKTLLQVLGLTGGNLNRLGSHTVAALLSSTNPDVNYAYTTTQVIQMFNDVYPGGDYETLKNKFAFENEKNCPLY